MASLDPKLACRCPSWKVAIGVPMDITALSRPAMASSQRMLRLLSGRFRPGVGGLLAPLDGADLIFVPRPMLTAPP